MIRYRINPLVSGLSSPPIAEVQGWVGTQSAPDRPPLLDVSQAVPSYGPPGALVDHLAERLKDPETARYTGNSGLPELRAAMSSHLNEDYGGATRPDEISIASGCNQAFCAVMDTITRPGDQVILILPWYFNHQMWLSMRGVEVRCPPFIPGGEPRAADIADCITGPTRAIVLVTPNNPTGQEYSHGLLEEVFDLAAERGVALVIDETYKDFRSTPGPPHNLLRKREWDETLIQLFSFSKSLALTGYRVGAIAASGDLIAQVEKVQDNLAICPSHPGQLAALYGLEHLAEWRREKADLLRERCRQLQKCFHRCDLEYALASCGTYFAYIRHPFGDTPGTSMRVARRLAEQFNLLSLPGSMFGPGQEAYLRFAFSNIATAQIPELVDRLAASQA